MPDNILTPYIERILLEKPGAQTLDVTRWVIESVTTKDPKGWKALCDRAIFDFVVSMVRDAQHHRRAGEG